MAATQEIVAPLTVETYDKSNITFGKPHDITEYRFRKISVGYSHPDSTDDDFNVLIRGVVRHASAPNDKCSTHSALISVSDESMIEFIKQLDTDVAEAFFKNRKTLLDGYNIKGSPAVDKIKTLKTLLGFRKKSLLKYNKDYDSYSFGIQFGKDITIEHSDSIPEEQRNAEDPVAQLAKGTEVVVAANLNSLSINTSNSKWNLKFAATQFGCLSVSQSSGERDPSDIWGYALDDLDVEKVNFKSVETNSYGGKSLPVKYNGRGKETNLSLKLEDVQVYFLKNVDKNSGKVRFSLAVNIDDNSKFEELDNTILDYLFKNQSKITDQDEVEDKEIFSTSFNGSLSEKEGNHTLWTNLYVKTTDGDYDFDGKVYHATGTNEDGNPTFDVMSNDDIMKQLVEGKDKVTANVSVYIRYVWLGESYSVKWYLSKAQVFTKAAKKFNLGITSIIRDEEEDEFDGATGDLVDEVDADPTEVASADDATTEDEED
jgi:hypothetical protein